MQKPLEGIPASMAGASPTSIREQSGLLLFILHSAAGYHDKGSAFTVIRGDTLSGEGRAPQQHECSAGQTLTAGSNTGKHWPFTT